MVKEHGVTLNMEAVFSSEALALTWEDSEDHDMNIHYCAHSSPGQHQIMLPIQLRWNSPLTGWMYHQTIHSISSALSKKNSGLYAQCSTVPFFLSMSLTQNTPNKDANDSGFSNFLLTMSSILYGQHFLCSQHIPPWEHNHSRCSTFSVPSVHTSYRTHPLTTATMVIIKESPCTRNPVVHPVPVGSE